MDADRFDALSRALSTGHTRRRLTRLLGGLSLGGVLTVLGLDAVSAAKLNGGARCTTKTQCKSGRCLNPNKCDCTKSGCRCSCACSTTDPKIRCVQPKNPCKQAVCTQTGRCAIQDKPCPTGMSCCGGACVDTQTDPDHCGTCTTQCTAEAPESCGQNGSCSSGTCTLWSKVECGPRSCEGNTTKEFICRGTGSCTENTSDCSRLGRTCADGICKKSNGASCQLPGECASGFCVGSVCCESACDDGILCTDDTCAAGTGICTHAVNDANCEPTQTCDPQFDCVGPT